ncbi:MAG: hypothetical protein ACI82H_001477, partial [Alphaproteobacteria bacterium]
VYHKTARVKGCCGGYLTFQSRMVEKRLRPVRYSCLH